MRDSDRAYDTLLEMILDLRLAPGDVINEQFLVRELGIGRMPIREAVARLAGDRFLTVLPRRGTVVTPLALKDVLDIFEAREAVECGLAFIAARRASPEDMDQLRQLARTADRARGSGNSENYLLCDQELHTFLAHMVNNTFVQDAADRLLLHNLRFWRMYFRSNPPQETAMLSHEKLLSAIEASDGLAASEAMREHIAESRGMLQVLF